MKKNIRIITITKPNCHACSKLRHELEKRDIPYEAVEVKKAEEIFNQKFPGAPITLVIDHDIHPYKMTRIHGYGKITFERILEAIGYNETNIPRSAGGTNA